MNQNSQQFHDAISSIVSFIEQNKAACAKTVRANQPQLDGEQALYAVEMTQTVLATLGLAVVGELPADSQAH
jgi:hypothetical protein